MFVPISIDRFIKLHKKNNPNEDIKIYREKLMSAVQAKTSGKVCINCGNSIWALCSATVEWNGCFTCITGESDNHEDYEIDSVCF